MILPRIRRGPAPVLLIADHASNHVPPDVRLDIAPALLETHIAVDIGAAALTEALAVMADATAIIAAVSRLVIDLNREPEAAAVIPVSSDGHAIGGNAALGPDERRSRLDAIHRPYHAAIAAQIADARPRLIVSVHSFTPRLAARPAEVRPWPIGILYNQDRRAAESALGWLAANGVMAGDNEPYSGRDLNYTMNRHAEANAIPYLGLELRQDEIDNPDGIRRWCELLSRLIADIAAGLPRCP